MTEIQALLDLRADPPRAGRLAGELRERWFGRHTRIAPTPTQPEWPTFARLRDAELEPLSDWPEPDDWRSGDRVSVVVEPQDAQGQRLYVEWLLRLAAKLGPGAELGLAPWSREPGGTARLWAIAVARIVLPARVRIEARHDLIGIRLAQVALAFGADTLAGPLAPDRKLPVAGVTRPTEATLGGLTNLIEQAGFEPESTAAGRDSSASSRESSEA